MAAMSRGRDLANLLNLTDKEAQKRVDEFIASEMFLLALCDDKNEAGRLAKQHGLSCKSLEAAIMAVRGGQGWIPRMPKVNGVPQEILYPPHGTGGQGKLDPVIGRTTKIRRRHPDSAAPHQEQPGADR